MTQNRWVILAVAAWIGCFIARAIVPGVFIAALAIFALRPKFAPFCLIVALTFCAWGHRNEVAANIVPTGSVHSCTDVLRWPQIDSFGNTSVVGKLGVHQVLLTGRPLNSRKLEPFESVCISGMYEALPEYNADYFRAQHVVARVVVESISQVAPAPFPFDLVDDLRVGWNAASDHMDLANAALFRGIVFGDTNGQSLAEAARFRASGLSHITAVSGENVAFVLMVVFAITGPPRKWHRAIAVLAIIALFVVLTEFQASVLRAALMASLAVIDEVTGRPRSSRERLAICVLLLLGLDPLLVHRASFCLSVGACAGIAFFQSIISTLFKSKSRVSSTISVAIAAQLGIVWPLAAMLHRFPPASSLLYILIEPVVAFLMVIGVSWGLVVAHLGSSSVAIYIFVATFCVKTVRVTAAFGATWPEWLQITAWIPIGAMFLVAIANRRLTSTHDGRTITHLSN